MNIVYGVVSFIWKCLVSYIVKRCDGVFMDNLFDFAIDKFVEATPSKVDDEFRDRWKKKKLGL